MLVVVKERGEHDGVNYRGFESIELDHHNASEEKLMGVQKFPLDDRVEVY